MSPGWRDITFGEVFDITSSKRVLKKQWKSVGVPFYRAREIVKLSQHGTVENDLFISEELFAEFKARYGVPEPGDLMVSAVGTLGACYAVKAEDRFYFKDASVLRFNPKELVDSRFIQHLFRTNQILAQINSGAGSTVGTYTISRAKKTRLSLPPLAEQKRIAGILDAADALRARRRESLAQLDTLLQSTFLDMFGDPVTNPMGWEVREVGSEINFLTSGSRGWAKYYSDSGDTFIRIQNLKNGRLDLDEIAYVNAPESAESKRTKVEPGDVLLSITADLGRTAVVPRCIGKAHINQHLAILRFTDMNPIFISLQLASEGGQTQFNRLNREGVKAGLNFNDVKSIQLIKPPRERQQRFAAIVESVEQQKVAQRAHLMELDTLFAALQQRAFGGEL